MRLMLTLLILKMVWLDMLDEIVGDENHESVRRETKEYLDHASVGLSETWLEIPATQMEAINEAVGCTALMFQ